MNTEREQEYWDQVSSTFVDGNQYALWRRHSDQVNRRLLADWLPKNCIRRLLKTDLFDEAVSAGLYPVLSRHADLITGIDLSSQAVQAARSRYPQMDCREGDLRQLPFDDGVFDCIVSNSSLDHFPTMDELDSAMNQLFRVLRPGGTLILTLDNPQNPLIWLRSVLPLSWLKKAGLVPYYVGKSMGHTQLSASLRQKGFEIADSRGIMHCPRVLSVRRASRIQHASPEKQQSFLDSLVGWERFADWPTRFFTAHFVAVLAKKPE